MTANQGSLAAFAFYQFGIKVGKQRVLLVKTYLCPYKWDVHLRVFVHTAFGQGSFNLYSLSIFSIIGR